MNGFLLIDKPKGVTSFYCVKVLRKICGIRKIGFVGTLDPLATGLLIFAVGEATKLISFLEGADKVYEVAVKLGATSNTYDADGEITKTIGFDYEKSGASQIEKSGGAQTVKITRSKIEETLEDDFTGQIKQKPPKFSAVQIEGKRAYELARKDIQVELKSRVVSIHDIKVKSYAWPILRLTVHCSSGTYIRSLAHDLGQKLGCGGYVSELRRVKNGSFNVKNAVSINDINKMNLYKFIILPQELFKDLLHLHIKDHEYSRLSNGGFIANETTLKQGNLLAIYKEQCVGMLSVHCGKLKFAKKFNIVSCV